MPFPSPIWQPKEILLFFLVAAVNLLLLPVFYTRLNWHQSSWPNLGAMERRGEEEKEAARFEHHHQDILFPCFFLGRRRSHRAFLPSFFL